MDTVQEVEFSYCSLPNNIAKPFRLLYIYPGLKEDDIDCCLVDADLDAAANTFEALSYVWGDTTIQKPIKVNDLSFNVGTSLHSALLHLRRPTEHRVIWADAICINQGDIPERVAQVGLMRDIYRQASQTTVWLGEAHEHTENAFKAIRILGNKSLGMENSGQKSDQDKGDADKELLDFDFELDPILKNKWWTRVWTLQEIALAKRASLHMADEEVDWDFFVRAVRHGQATDLAVFSTTFFGSPMRSMADSVDTVVLIQKSPDLGNHGMQFLLYMESAHLRDATDPRDKLFGLLGLMTHDIRIEVDYNSPASEVFIKSTRALIEASATLDVLGFCFPYKIGQLDSSLPSWVPQWGSTGTMARPMMVYANGQLRTTNASRGFSCAPRWRNDADGTTMMADGFVVDTIKSLAPVLPSLYLNNVHEGAFEFMDDFDDQTNTTDNPDQTFAQICSELWDICKALGKLIKGSVSQLLTAITGTARYIEWEDFVQEQMGPPGKNTATSNEIFCEILSVGTQYPGGPAETRAQFERWSKSLGYIRKLRAVKVHRMSTKMFKSAGFLFGLYSEVTKTNDNFGSILDHTLERRMGITQTGRFCLLPKLAQEGDQVAILKAGRVPLVLRPRGNGYVELIGESYVHGIMDGEVLGPNVHWSEFLIN